MARSRKRLCPGFIIKKMGIELAFDCETVNRLREYKGMLTLSQAGVPLAFDFVVEYRPDLAAAADESMRNIDDFLNNTRLDLYFRGIPIQISRELKSVLLFLMGSATIQHECSPQQDPLES